MNVMTIRRARWTGVLALTLAAVMIDPLPATAAPRPKDGPLPSAGSWRGAGGPLAVAAQAQVDVMVEMEAAPAAQVFAAFAAARGGDDNVASAPVAAAATRSQVEQIAAAQAPVANAIESLGGTVLFQAQRVYNGVAAKIDASKVAQLASLPGVKAVHRLVSHELDHTVSVPFIGAPQAWVKGLGYRGQGIKVGVIDTGIDYLHTNFGGPGTNAAYLANNTTVAGDVWNYPGVKVAGGWDFAGDAYTGSNTPAPDSDPMDCNGHGSHVAGSVAGYGVRSDGTTYPGPWGDGSPFASMRIGPGVAPQATLYALRVFGCTGSTNLTVAALDWAMDPNGDGDFSDRLDVVNMSLGSSFGGTYDASAVASDNAAAAGVIVVASAGNSGDTHFITGSPGTSGRTISVASSKDSSVRSDAIQVTAPPSIAGIKQAADSVFGADLRIIGDVVSDVQYTTPANGCTALTGFTAGRIALVDRGTCSFKTKALMAQNAGAVGVLIANNTTGLSTPGDDPAIPTTITIPVHMILQADGTAMKTELAVPNTVTVRMSADLRGSFVSTDTADTVSSFTSRGPSRGGLLKPDVSSIGDTVYSTRNRSGVDGVSFNGTSMAAPHVAGTMAILKQLHPSWSVAELKALVMNTAHHNVFLTGTSPVVGPGRVGAGRQNVASAATSNVVAYADDATGRVSVSFGSLDVPPSGASYTRTVRVANKSATSKSFNLAYVSQATASGVTVTTSVPSITVGANSSATFDVVLAANPANMKHDRDASIATTQLGLARAWVTEESGYVSLTPVSGPVLRVPVHAMPRPASVMGASTPALNIAGGTGTANVTLGGTDVNTGQPSPVYPTDIVSLVSAFELQETSPELVAGDDTTDSADLAHVGVANAGTNVVFGIATHGPWSTPQANDTEFDIYIDNNLDNTWDYVMFNWNAGSAAASSTIDAFYSVICAAPFTTCAANTRLNMISPGTRDTNLHNSDVLAIGAPKSALGITGAFRYQVVGFNREEGFVDLSAVLGYNPSAPGLSMTGTVAANSTLFTDLNGGTIPVTFNRTNYLAAASQGLLLLHHHNATGNRAEVVPVLTEMEGDFNGDGKADIAFQNDTTGDVGFWFMDGTTAIGSAMLSQTGDPSWKVVGTADFDGDGHPDLIFVNDLTGDVAVSFLNGTTVVGGTMTTPGNIGLDWKIVATGDLDGDGDPDLVFRQSSTGAISVWFMSGTTMTGGGFTSPSSLPSSWSIAGARDFNGDGKADLLFQEAGGTMAVWYMDGLNAVGSAFVDPPTVGSDWKIRAVPDFNGDAHADFLFHSVSTGNLGAWLMDGVTMDASVGVTPGNLTGWTIVGPR